MKTFGNSNGGHPEPHALNLAAINNVPLFFHRFSKWPADLPSKFAPWSVADHRITGRWNRPPTQRAAFGCSDDWNYLFSPRGSQKEHFQSLTRKAKSKSPIKVSRTSTPHSLASDAQRATFSVSAQPTGWVQAICFWSAQTGRSTLAEAVTTART